VYNLFIGDDDGSGANGNATFTSPQGAVFLTVANPGMAVKGDFNNDGNLDFAAAAWNVGAEAAIMLGNGLGTFNEAPARLTVGDAAEYGAAEDFNGDGILDIVFAAVWSDQLYIYLGDGTGLFSLAVGSPLLTGRAPRCVHVADYNNDYISDIAVAYQTNAELYVYLGN
jgi:hypothetical protein